MAINVGEKIPDAIFIEATAEGPSKVTSEEFFAGRKVVLFAVPGAFTATCHQHHLPGFLEHYDSIKSKGVDDIAVVAVNDVHVMGAWADATKGLGKIHYLADGSAAFAKAVGLEVDLTKVGMGIRSQRYSMIVEDGVVTSLNAGDVPGETEISGAARIMEQL